MQKSTNTEALSSSYVRRQLKGIGREEWSRFSLTAQESIHRREIKSSISHGFPEKQNQMCVCVPIYVCIQTYFRELAYVIEEEGRSKICRAGQQSGDTG